MANDAASTSGEVHVVLTGPDGQVKHDETFHNMITQVGEQMYGEAALAANSVARPTAMQLGTGSTAAAKTGAGAAIVTLVASSQVAIGTPTSGLSGAGNNPRRITYSATWAAGTATATGISEVALNNQSAATQTVAPAANTISRAVLGTTVNKGASDSLTITWTHDIGVA